MLFQLPVEILLLMISKLQPGDLKQFRLVSRLCRSISIPAFMMHLVVDDTPGRLRALQAFLRTHTQAMDWPRLSYLALDGFQIKGHCFCDFLRPHPNLRQVMIQRIEFS